MVFSVALKHKQKQNNNKNPTGNYYILVSTGVIEMPVNLWLALKVLEKKKYRFN